VCKGDIAQLEKQFLEVAKWCPGLLSRSFTIGKFIEHPSNQLILSLIKELSHNQDAW
jgi:hypothetical protein